MRQDLNSPDREVRESTVANLQLHGPPFDELIPLLSAANDDPDDRIRQHVGYVISSIGGDCSPDQAAELESRIEACEFPVVTRLLLLGHYSPADPSDRVKLLRRAHILWLIANAPEEIRAGVPDCELLESNDSDGYQIAKERWLSQIDLNSSNTRILAAAAGFFTLNDLELSERLLIQGRELDSENPYWSERLGHLYSLGASRSDGTGASARSLSAFEEAERVRRQKVGDGQADEADEFGEMLTRRRTLADLAKSAIEAFEYEKARHYASELLSLAHSDQLPEYFRNDGNAVHYGNLVLGRVAFAAGEIEQAKEHLLASGRCEGSPNLGSFGPNMSLAKELLECGEREVVLEYFELCADFWELGAEQLAEWQADVRRGAVPEFGANLVY